MNCVGNVLVMPLAVVMISNNPIRDNLDIQFDKSIYWFKLYCIDHNLYNMIYNIIYTIQMLVTAGQISFLIICYY